MHPFFVAVLLYAAYLPVSLSQEPEMTLSDYCSLLNVTECVPDFPLGGDSATISKNNVKPGQKPNHWKIELFSVENLAGPVSNLSASFYLYRSIWTPCQNDQSSKSAPGNAICFWQISQDPVWCKSDYFKVGEWQTCQIYVKGVEGERFVSAETQNRLKWRFIDPTNDLASDAESTTINSLVTQMQIVYGVPLSESRGRDRGSSETAAEGSIIAYSTTLDFPSDSTGCRKGGGYQDLNWNCGLNLGPKSTCRASLGLMPGTICYTILDVKEESIKPKGFAKKYW